MNFANAYSNMILEELVTLHENILLMSRLYGNYTLCLNDEGKLEVDMSSLDISYENDIKTLQKNFNSNIEKESDNLTKYEKLCKVVENIGKE